MTVNQNYNQSNQNAMVLKDLPVANRRGRKKAVGSVDTSNGRISFVAGYCEHGELILLSPTELEQLITQTWFKSKEIPQKLFLHLNKHFSQ